MKATAVCRLYIFALKLNFVQHWKVISLDEFMYKFIPLWHKDYNLRSNHFHLVAIEVKGGPTYVKSSIGVHGKKRHAVCNILKGNLPTSGLAGLMGSKIFVHRQFLNLRVR